MEIPKPHGKTMSGIATNTRTKTLKDYEPHTHLRGGHYGEGVHDPVGELFADFGDEEGAEAGASAAPEGVRQLEACERRGVR